LITYRVDPEVALGLVPEPFRPQLVDGHAVAGVCMIGLRDVRPGWFNPRVGIRTENVAHRIAVEWDEAGEARTGVYIVERHSSSLIPVIAGGWLFPGVQKRARFFLDETDTRFRVKMDAPSTRVAVDVDLELTEPWKSELFPDLATASAFHEEGCVGWSPKRNGRGVEPIELTSTDWMVEPAEVRAIESSYFDALPPGSAVLDSALVMRDIPFFWETPSIEPVASHGIAVADSAV
jgi:hypothetical protein